MNIQARLWLNGMAFVLGAFLCIGGIARRTPGAWIIGLPIAAINLEQWLQAKKLRPPDDKGNGQGQDELPGPLLTEVCR
jgi:hypothetical protein